MNVRTALEGIAELCASCSEMNVRTALEGFVVFVICIEWDRVIRHIFVQVLDSTSTSEAEYNVFRDVVLPLGCSPAFATRSHPSKGFVNSRRHLCPIRRGW
jgi:hypothetical protein